jgi:hypothetical protein
LAGATKELLLLAKLGNKAKSLPINAGGLCVIILDSTKKESQGLDPELQKSIARGGILSRVFWENLKIFAKRGSQMHLPSPATEF